jgi:hypothetical protein
LTISPDAGSTAQLIAEKSLGQIKLVSDNALEDSGVLEIRR